MSRTTASQDDEKNRVNTRWRDIALVMVLAIAPGTAMGCGLEDPNSVGVQRGMLQLAYPQALHVGTAVWQAQIAGTLPRDVFAQQADLSPEARARLRMFKANALLAKLAARLNAAPVSTRHPSVAIVLLGPVLWSRMETVDGVVSMKVHVAGPERDDVVAVTEIAVIEAIAEGQIDVSRAVEAGLLRLYGRSAEVSDAYDWLALATRG